MSGTVTMPMMSAPPMSMCVRFEALNPIARNIEDGRSGSDAVRWRSMNSPKAATVATKYTPNNVSGSSTRDNASVRVDRLTAIRPPPR